MNHKVDIIGLAECNVDWRTCTESLADRFDGWFHIRNLAAQIIEKSVPNYPNLFNQEELQQLQQMLQQEEQHLVEWISKDWVDGHGFISQGRTGLQHRLLLHTAPSKSLTQQVATCNKFKVYSPRL